MVDVRWIQLAEGLPEPPNSRDYVVLVAFYLLISIGSVNRRIICRNTYTKNVPNLQTISTPIITAKLVQDDNKTSARVVKAKIEKTTLGQVRTDFDLNYG